MNGTLRATLSHRVARVTAVLVVLTTALAAIWIAHASPNRATRDGSGAGPGTAPQGQTPWPSSREPESAATGTAAPATPTPTAGPADGAPDLLDRTDPRPDGVAAQLEIFMGGGPCPEDDSSGRPTIATHDEQVIPSPIRACLLGFRPAPLTATLTRPDGAAESKPMTYLGGGIGTNVGFMLRPGWPTGSYRLSARQGDSEATAFITVRLATEPTIYFATRELRAGEDNPLYLGGYPPDRPVTLYLYGSRRLGARPAYRTSFTLPIDSRGEGHIVDPQPPAPPRLLRRDERAQNQPGEAKPHH